VNAVLRKVIDLDLTQELDAAKMNGVKRLAVETSQPEWLLNRWLKTIDDASVQARCRYNNSVPQNWIRYNPLKVEREKWEAFLTENGLEWSNDPRFPDFFRVAQTGTLFHSTAYTDGWFSVQDAAAGLAPRLLNPQVADIVLDLCAAPGGKSTYLSELSGGNASVIAYDSAPVRIEQMQTNFNRLGHPGLSCETADVTQVKLPEADKILLDVPCSGTGVLNRRADLRWRRTINDIQDLVDIQAKMLENAWLALKPGGLMVYSTCTMEPEENWQQIQHFLDHETTAEIEAPDDQKLHDFMDENGAVVTVPERDQLDGMFVIRLRKKLS